MPQIINIVETLNPSDEAVIDYGELVAILTDTIDTESSAKPFTLVKNGIVITL